MLYQIADLTVEMDCSPYGRTVRQAAPYLSQSDEPPKLHLPSSDEIAALAAKRFPMFNEEEGEYMTTGACFYEQLIRFDGLLLHAAALSMDGRGYAFTAPSGTGKSTHAGLWIRHFGAERVVYLNDDKPALRVVDGAVRVYGTPWSGKTALNCNAYAPLCGICVLSRAAENSVTRLSAREALPYLLDQTLRPTEPTLLTALLTTLDTVLRTVPVYALACNQEEAAAEVAYRALSQP